MPKRRRGAAQSRKKKKKPVAAYADGYWEIERVLDRRCRQGVVECLVQWKGDYENTWEPAENLSEKAWQEAVRLADQQAARKLGLTDDDVESKEAGAPGRSLEADRLKMDVVELLKKAAVNADGDDHEDEGTTKPAPKEMESGEKGAIKDDGSNDDQNWTSTVLATGCVIDTEGIVNGDGTVDEDEDGKPHAEESTASMTEADLGQVHSGADDTHFDWSGGQIVKQPIERLSVSDADTPRRVTEARLAGTPVVLTGATGWAQFAQRWLVRDGDMVTYQPDSTGEDASADDELPLDLSQPHRLDVQKMIDDIGDEFVPILRKDYDETSPIKEQVTVSRFLGNCWPDDRVIPSRKPASDLYLHQWLFTGSETAVSKLCGKSRTLPNGILGEDLLRYWYDPEQCAGDSPYQYLFMGNAGTMSKLHKDKGGLLITIAPIIGQKEVVLVHRADGASSLYHLEASIEKPDLHTYPLLYSARVWKSVIQPGEILILPQGTYHQCRNVTPCLSYHHFHLDTVNLKAFFESWRDKDAPEVQHEEVIWNAAVELSARVKTFVEILRKNPERPTDIPDDIASAVPSLGALHCICRELAIRGLSDFDRFATEIEATLHRFRFRCCIPLPPFRSKSGPSSGRKKNKVQSKKYVSPASLHEGSLHSSKLIRAFHITPKLKPESQGVVISDSSLLSVGDAILVQLHCRPVHGIILSIWEDLFAVMVHYEGYSCFDDQFVPLEQLRVHNAELHPSDLKSDMTVTSLEDDGEEYLSVVKYWRQGTFYKVKLLLNNGEVQLDRWLSRDCIIQKVQSSEAFASASHPTGPTSGSARSPPAINNVAHQPLSSPNSGRKSLAEVLSQFDYSAERSASKSACAL